MQQDDGDSLFYPQPNRPVPFTVIFPTSGTMFYPRVGKDRVTLAQPPLSTSLSPDNHTLTQLLEKCQTIAAKRKTLFEIPIKKLQRKDFEDYLTFLCQICEVKSSTDDESTLAQCFSFAWYQNDGICNVHYEIATILFNIGTLTFRKITKVFNECHDIFYATAISDKFFGNATAVIDDNDRDNEKQKCKDTQFNKEYEPTTTGMNGISQTEKKQQKHRNEHFNKQLAILYHLLVETAGIFEAMEREFSTNSENQWISTASLCYKRYTDRINFEKGEEKDFQKNNVAQQNTGASWKDLIEKPVKSYWKLHSIAIAWKELCMALAQSCKYEKACLIPLIKFKGIQEKHEFLGRMATQMKQRWAKISEDCLCGIMPDFYYKFMLNFYSGVRVYHTGKVYDEKANIKNHHGIAVHCLQTAFTHIKNACKYAKNPPIKAIDNDVVVGDNSHDLAGPIMYKLLLNFRDYLGFEFRKQKNMNDKVYYEITTDPLPELPPAIGKDFMPTIKSYLVYPA